jgi:predicted transglutaminase-like cysteine proteinase
MINFFADDSTEKKGHWPSTQTGSLTYIIQHSAEIRAFPQRALEQSAVPDLTCRNVRCNFLIKNQNMMKLAPTIAALVLMLTPARAEEPFGVATVPTQDETLIAIWHDLQLDIASDEFRIASCRAEPNCDSAAAKRFIAIVDEARRHRGRTLLGHLNRAVNAAIPTTRGDVPMYAPLPALTYPGDCKSYAVVKYVALGDAGVVAADRKIILVWDNARPDETHVVVVVREGDHWLILDNLTLTLVDSTAAYAYQPLHEFGTDGVRDFPPLPPLGGPL